MAEDLRILDLPPGTADNASLADAFEHCEHRPIHIQQLEDASENGDLVTVKLLFETHWLALELSGTPEGQQLIGALHAAVQHDHPHVADYLLSQGVPAETRFYQFAVHNTSYHMLEVFLKHNWDINQQVSYCKPPLLAETFHNLPLMLWFLSHGASPNARCVIDETPLSIAIRDAPLEVIQLLLDNGGSTEHGDLLHSAICRQTDDCLDIVKLVLAKGAPINLLEYQNDAISWSWWKPFGLGTPLHTAAKLGKIDIVRELLNHGANPSIRDTCGKLALDVALAGGQNVIVEMLQPTLDSFAHKL